MANTQLVLSDVNAALQVISVASPILFAAYQGFRTIWLLSNPGKSEADYIAYLITAATRTISDSDAILISIGYKQDAQGHWAPA